MSGQGGGRWEDREPDFGRVYGELGRLVRRARKRWLLVLVITVGLVGLVAARDLRRQRSYDAEVILSATEGDDVQLETAHTNSRLQDYIWYAIFTDRALSETIAKFDFRPDLVQKNPRQSLDSFRDDVDVDLYKNEFAQERYPGQPPRSARIAIRMRHPDPDKALAIARYLGDLVVSRDADARRERFDKAQLMASSVVSFAETDLGRLQRDLRLLEALYRLETPTRRAELSVSLANLDREIVGSLARLKDARDTQRRVQLESSANDESLALRYQRVEWGAAPTRIRLEFALLLTLLGALAVLFPLVVLGVGAFDPRLYDERDVRRLGLRPLGLVKKASMKPVEIS